MSTIPISEVEDDFRVHVVNGDYPGMPNSTLRVPAKRLKELKMDTSKWKLDVQEGWDWGEIQFHEEMWEYIRENLMSDHKFLSELNSVAVVNPDTGKAFQTSGKSLQRFLQPDAWAAYAPDNDNYAVVAPDAATFWTLKLRLNWFGCLTQLIVVVVLIAIPVLLIMGVISLVKWVF